MLEDISNVEEVIMYILLNIPWPLLFLGIYLFVFIIIMQKNNKDFVALIKRATTEKYTDEQLYNMTVNYIKKHPLSLYNSDLRIKVLPSLLTCGTDQEIRRLVRKIRIVDLHRQMEQNMIYALFLLRENEYKEAYQELFNKASKSLRIQNNEWYSFFLNNCENIDILHDYANMPYFQGVKYYYLGKQYVDDGKFEDANTLFQKSFDLIHENAFYKLLVTRGFSQ